MQDQVSWLVAEVSGLGFVVGRGEEGFGGEWSKGKVVDGRFSSGFG